MLLSSNTDEKNVDIYCDPSPQMLFHPRKDNNSPQGRKIDH